MCGGLHSRTPPRAAPLPGTARKVTHISTRHVQKNTRVVLKKRYTEKCNVQRRPRNGVVVRLCCRPRVAPKDPPVEAAQRACKHAPTRPLARTRPSARRLRASGKNVRNCHPALLITPPRLVPTPGTLTERQHGAVEQVKMQNVDLHYRQKGKS